MKIAAKQRKRRIYHLFRKMSRECGRTTNASSHDTDSTPRYSLEEIIGEGDEVESISVWDTAIAAACGSESAHCQVRV